MVPGDSSQTTKLVGAEYLIEKQIVRDQKSLRVEHMRSRPNAIRPSSVAIILIACSLLVLHGIANAEGAEQKAGLPVAIRAHYEAPPDHYDMAPPCSAWTSVPSRGTCRGLGRNTGPERITGDWQGQSEYAYGFFILPSGHSYGSGVDHFTGTISGCGTGSVVYQALFSYDGKSNFQGHWQMIEGSGTGGLASLRGTGTFSQTTKPDGATIGDYNGTVYCSK
jgi:hypothetical protein